MAEIPAVKRTEPENPHHDPDRSPPAADKPARPRRRKFLATIVLAVIGVALLSLGLGIYPRRAAVPATASPSVYVGSNSSYVINNVETVSCMVDQVHPDLAKVTVDVSVGGGN